MQEGQVEQPVVAWAREEVDDLLARASEACARAARTVEESKRLQGEQPKRNAGGDVLRFVQPPWRAIGVDIEESRGTA